MDTRVPLLDPTRLGIERPPFSLFGLLADADTDLRIEDASYRRADDDHWASVRYRVPLPGALGDGAATVKQWVNDWWPPTCPDLPLRDRGRLVWIPATSGFPGAPRPSWWACGLDYHGTEGMTAHLGGTNVEVRLPDGVDADSAQARDLVSRFVLVAHGPRSWFERSYHPHRDIPDRGWGDNLVAGLDWAPWVAAPEHPSCPSPDLLVAHRLPAGWLADATGARANPRLDHHERQWVVIDEVTGDPLLWARAVPLGTRHPHPLLVRADSRYRLDWEETPVGWCGSLDSQVGHHVVLLERGGLRIEVWVGLQAGLTRRAAAATVDRVFVDA